MFEVGKVYRFTMGEPDGGTSQFTSKVVAIEGTLIKLSNPFTRDTILNTASTQFVSAELQDDAGSGTHRWQDLVAGFDVIDQNA